MQALSEGVIIEAKFRTGSTWDEIHNTLWRNFNFAEYEYRIKPEPKEPSLLERIEEKWGDKTVILLKLGELDAEQERLFLIMDDRCGVRSAHVLAQSMKGFAGYVYEKLGFNDREPSDKFELHCDPSLMYIGVDKRFIRQPIAVLFTK